MKAPWYMKITQVETTEDGLTFNVRFHWLYIALMKAKILLNSRIKLDV